MRYIMMIIGAAVVAYFLTIGIRAFISERNTKTLPEKTDNSSKGKEP